MRGLRPSVTLRVALTAVLVVGVAGTLLERFVIRELRRFAEERVAGRLLEHRDALRRTCEDAYDSLLREGRAGDARHVRVAQARTLGRVEDYAAAHGIGVVIAREGRELLSVPAPAAAPGARGIDLGFEPWGWRISVVDDPGEYAALIGTVQRAYALTGIVLVLATVALVLPLERSVGGPLRAIARAVREKRAPPIRGAGEIRLLAEALGGAMRGLEAERLALERSLAALARAQEVAQLGSWEWDAAAGRDSWSPEVFRILGLPADTVPSPERFLLAVHPGDVERVGRAVVGLRGGSPFEIEHRVLRPDGSVRTVVSRGEATAREGGRAVRLTGTIHDVTERRLIEEELRRAQSLEALGLLAGGVAHDFNNLLTALLGNIELARELLPPGSPARRHLEEAGRAHEMTRRLTGQFLTFARGGAPERRRLALGPLVEETVRFALSGSPVRAAFQLPAAPVLLDGDPAQLAQVFQNLAVNALDAMPGGGTLEVSLEEVAVGEGSPLPLDPGRHARLAFRDDGPGIPEAILEDIFTPYFSTKARPGGRGRGLGLAICHSVAKRHGGHIRVDAAPGSGSTFTVWFPVAAPPPPAGAGGPAA